MEKLELATNYSLDDTKREKLFPLFEKVFGVKVDTLKDFYKRGFWNPTYRPYTFFDTGRAVANVSMFSLPISIHSTLVNAAGIQSVMTDPDYRRQGLMKHLLEKMLKDIDQEYELAFLYTETPSLYTPFRFRQVQEHYFEKSTKYIPKKGNNTLRKMDYFEVQDLQIMRKLFLQNTPISRCFAPITYDSSFFFNMYDRHFQQKVYYSAELQVMIVFEVEGETLKLYDIIGGRPPSLEEIYSQIPTPFKRVELFFSPDLFHDSAFKPVQMNSSSSLMVRGRFDMEKDYFKYPITAMF
ncbi:MAG TPA: GNAT family N-acetyltransferase [Bacilli bacterium]